MSVIVIAAKKGVLIMGANFKIRYVTVAMI